MYKVRFVNPQKQYADHKEELLGAIDDILTRGALVTNKELSEFEQNFAKFLGVRHALGVNSGTSALDVALQAAGIGPGDEVVSVAHTFIASISTICLTGAKAVLIDVGQDFNMDASLIEKALSPKTKAILPAHFNGRLCDVEVIMQIAKSKGLMVIEDAAQALGATMKMSDGQTQKGGTFGIAGCFSLYWAKALGGPGTSGEDVTNDDDMAIKMRLMRYNGEDRESREFRHHAHNFLMDNIRAAFLNVKMKYLPGWLARRKEIANLYLKGLGDLKQVQLPYFNDSQREDIYNNYVIRAERRDELEEYFKKGELVETLVQYKRPMYEEPIMRETKDKMWRFGNDGNSLPETEKLSGEVISLPMYPELTNEEVEFVIKTLRDFYSS